MLPFRKVLDEKSFKAFINQDLTPYDFRFMVNYPLLSESLPKNLKAIERAEIFLDTSNTVCISAMPNDQLQILEEINQFAKSLQHSDIDSILSQNDLNLLEKTFGHAPIIRIDQRRNGNIYLTQTENYNIAKLLVDYFPQIKIKEYFTHIEGIPFYYEGNRNESICITWVGSFAFNYGAFLVGPAELFMNLIRMNNLQGCVEIKTDKCNRITLKFCEDFPYRTYDLVNILMTLCSGPKNPLYNDMVFSLQYARDLANNNAIVAQNIYTNSNDNNINEVIDLNQPPQASPTNKRKSEQTNWDPRLHGNNQSQIPNSDWCIYNAGEPEPPM